MTGRGSFAGYRARLDRLGFRPSRRRGQNFLLDPNLHRLIADAARLDSGDLALEIGAGLGFLTRELTARAGRVLAVEVDPRLVQVMRSELDGFPAGGRNLRLIEADALAGQDLHPAVGAALDEELAALAGRFAVVSNPPYAIAGPLLGLILGLTRLPDRVVVLVPRELAVRWAAPPGSRSHGGLSALVQAFYRPALLRVVGREAFRPRPRVESAVLLLAARPDSLASGAGLRRGFRGFLRPLFRSRRKTLAHGLATACRDLGLRAPAVDPEMAALRPEAVGPRRLLDLYRRVAGFS